MDDEKLEREFQTLATRWRESTGHLSSPTWIVADPAYRQIILLGQRAPRTILRCILAELRNTGGEWYQALEEISGQDPVPDDAAGDTKVLKQSWISWGVTRGYLEN